MGSGEASFTVCLLLFTFMIRMGGGCLKRIFHLLSHVSLKVLLYYPMPFLSCRRFFVRVVFIPRASYHHDTNRELLKKKSVQNVSLLNNSREVFNLNQEYNSRGTKFNTHFYPWNINDASYGHQTLVTLWEYFLKRNIYFPPSRRDQSTNMIRSQELHNLTPN